MTYRPGPQLPCPVCRRPIDARQLRRHMTDRHSSAGREDAKARGERTGKGRRQAARAQGRRVNYGW